MFSGIVEERGVVEQIAKKKDLATLTLRADKVTKGIKVGDSISVDGVCLTVTQKKGKRLTFDIMKETLQATTLGKIKKKSTVNLERALKVNSRINGHFVSGHIDAMGKVLAKISSKNYVEYKISLGKRLMRYIVEKGSVSVDGISLTVGSVGKRNFSIYLIPQTIKATTIGNKRKGDHVNVETDLLSKYIVNANNL